MGGAPKKYGIAAFHVIVNKRSVDTLHRPTYLAVRRKGRSILVVHFGKLDDENVEYLTFENFS